MIELSRITAAVEELARLRNDNARLRALIKNAETAAGYQSFNGVCCPWCGAELMQPEPHSADCMAFTPGGTVK